MFGDFDIVNQPSEIDKAYIVRIPTRVISLLKTGDFRIIKTKNDQLSIIDEDNQEVGSFISQITVAKLEETNKDGIYEEIENQKFQQKHMIIGDSTFQIEEGGPLSKDIVKKKTEKTKVVGSEYQQNHMKTSFLKSILFDYYNAEKYYHEVCDRYFTIQKRVAEKLSELDHELFIHSNQEFDQEKISEIYNEIAMMKQQLKAEESNIRMLQNYIDRFTNDTTKK